MAELTFDFDQLTPRMFVDFKEQTGQELMSLLDDAGEIDMQAMDSLALAGCVWLALRTSGHPDATWDDALDTPFTELQFGQADEPDPTSADDAG